VPQKLFVTSFPLSPVRFQVLSEDEPVMLRLDVGMMMLRLYVVPDDLRHGRQWPVNGMNTLYRHFKGNGNVQAAVAAGSPEYSNFTAPHEHDPLAIMFCFVPFS